MIKRKAKDSVFTNLFRRKEYALQLIKVLHPEENITEDDIEIISLENILTDGIYNDLGILLRDTLIILVEAQSTWNGNMAVRSFLYLAETYKRYIDSNKINMFTSETVRLPRPEVYVIFTGSRKEKPEIVKFSDHLSSKEDSSLELNVKMIYNSKEGDIIYQYINFCRVFDEMRKKYPDGIVTAVKETIKICRNKKLLSEFLSEHELELNDIMYDWLYDEEKWRKLMLRDERKKAREEGLAEGKADGLAEGKAEGLAEGRIDGIHEKAVETAKQAFNLNLPIEQIILLTGLSENELAKIKCE